MIPDWDPLQWEVVGAGLIVALACGLGTWWAVLDWLDRRAEAQPAPRGPRHAAAGERTRRIYPNRVRPPAE